LRVVDAGVVVALVAGDLDPDHLGDEELAVPHLIDSEVTSALRRLFLL
jgi:predicted nucleic acid-binding protein